MLVFFTNLRLMKFQVRHLAVFLLLSVIGGFGCFWKGSLQKNIHLMLEFLKTPFLLLHFSYYSLMTFLMMLSIVLLSMLMALLSNLSVIRHLIIKNNLNWLLKLNLIYETLWTGAKSVLLIPMLGKLNQFCLTGLITPVLLTWKWMGLFLRKIHLLRFFLLRFLCISINLSYIHVWNIVVTSELHPLSATWDWWTSYKSEYAGLFFL